MSKLRHHIEAGEIPPRLFGVWLHKAVQAPLTIDRIQKHTPGKAGGEGMIKIVNRVHILDIETVNGVVHVVMNDYQLSKHHKELDQYQDDLK